MATAQRDTGTREISLGNLSLNLDNYRTTVNGEAVDLSYEEFEVLSLLASQPEHVVSYETIARSLWDESGHRPVRRLNVLVHRLRLKLRDSWPFRVETVRRRGYGLLKAQPSEKRDA